MEQFWSSMIPSFTFLTFSFHTSQHFLGGYTKQNLGLNFVRIRQSRKINYLCSYMQRPYLTQRKDLLFSERFLSSIIATWNFQNSQHCWTTLMLLSCWYLQRDCLEKVKCLASSQIKMFWWRSTKGHHSNDRNTSRLGRKRHTSFEYEIVFSVVAGYLRREHHFHCLYDLFLAHMRCASSNPICNVSPGPRVSRFLILWYEYA